ncbi:MAG: hypothetical protein ABI591_18590 [Kofleriaceae bacterium]
MTSLPDWLVERAALDEVPPASRDRIATADPTELAATVAALRERDAAELAAHPAGPAIAQIQARIARTPKPRARTLRWGLLGLATSAAAVLVVVRLGTNHTAPVAPSHDEGHDGTTDGVRVKGPTRLVVFRQVGTQAERLEQDSIAHAGDLLQLRYDTGRHGYGVIASVDGAGVVTLHFPATEDAPPEATALAKKSTVLPHAYALDDAPKFERFFFITANEPIDVQQSLAALRVLAQRTDSADAALDLPAGLDQWSLRLKKPTHESP